MENQEQDTGFDPLFVRNMVESSLRIGLLALLLIMSYDIIKPFTVPILWGARGSLPLAWFLTSSRPLKQTFAFHT